MPLRIGAASTKLYIERGADWCGQGKNNSFYEGCGTSTCSYGTSFPSLSATYRLATDSTLDVSLCAPISSTGLAGIVISVLGRLACGTHTANDTQTRAHEMLLMVRLAHIVDTTCSTLGVFRSSYNHGSSIVFTVPPTGHPANLHLHCNPHCQADTFVSTLPFASGPLGCRDLFLCRFVWHLSKLYSRQGHE
jgi:hypothetical protein